MTRVLVTSIGSSPAIDISRSLRRDPSLTILGGDASSWGLRIGERLCDEIITLPRADTEPERYVEVLVALSRELDFIFISLDIELETWVRFDRPFACPSALPRPRIAAILLDKFATLSAARIPGDFPRTFEVAGNDDVAGAFEEIQGSVWFRPSVGTSGRASARLETTSEASTWMSFWRQRGVRGRWIAQEFLPGRNLNWSAIYVDGSRIAAASMERLEYFLETVAFSGVTGQVRLCRTIVDPAVEAVADRVVRAIDPTPNGIFSVDLKEDFSGVPKVTEINPRLAGRPWLYTSAGVNLPLAVLRAATGRDVGDAVAPSGLRAGVQLYRQLDVEPLIAEPPPDAS